jgi:hypothetical protein
VRSRRPLAPLFASLAVALLACSDDTNVAVQIGQPVCTTTPCPPPQGGGGIIVVTNGSLSRAANASAASASSSRAPSTAATPGPPVRERVFGPSPAGAARIAADNHAVAADAGTGGKNYDGDTNLDFGFDEAPSHVFLRLRLGDVPPRARILDATLEIQARFADTEPHCGVYAGLVARDGRWDGRFSGPRWAQAPDFDAIATARDAAGQALATTGLMGPGAANFGLEDTGDPVSLVSSTEVGQTLTVTRAGTLAALDLQLRRAGDLSGATRVRVERCRADDGSDDRPDGVPLGVSDPIDAGAIATVVSGGLVTYAFADGPALEAGARYAFVLESDAIGSAANHVQLKIHHGNAYAGGGLVNRGLEIAWNIVAYPALNQLPFFFEEDLVTPRAAPFGTLARIDEVPPFPAPDAWVAVADLTAQLQEWVDDRSYRPRDVVAIELFTTPDTPPGALRRGKDFRLRVTWRGPADPRHL